MQLYKKINKLIRFCRLNTKNFFTYFYMLNANLTVKIVYHVIYQFKKLMNKNIDFCFKIIF